MDCLIVGNKKKIITWLLEQQNEKKIYDLIEHKELRKIKQNKLLWLVLQELADKLETDKLELYKKYIREKGVFRVITIDNKSANTFMHVWQEKGIGWICEVVKKTNKTTDLLAYYGTSSYSSKQLANLLKYIIEDAKEIGIEIISVEEQIMMMDGNVDD
ncbi:MAG: hypothetical protein IJN13_00335 [Bacilli bacterium]|nr:hypothetical protein [Bacilli bacterium]